MTRRTARTAAIEDATPQRLGMSGGDNELMVAANDNGAPITTRRMTDRPLARLAGRYLLDPNHDANRTMYEAGERYFADWYAAGFAPLGAVDYSRVQVDCGGGSGGLNVSDFRLAAVERFRRAREEMGGYFAAIVDQVVLEERDLVSAGKDATGRNDRDAAQAVALDRLREGLRRLAKRYGTM